MPRPVFAILAACLGLACIAPAQAAEPWIRSAKSGPWSAADTWEAGQAPHAGTRVHVLPGHVVRYDVVSEQPIRTLYIAGTLSFAMDRDTRLDVGLIKIEAADEPNENGFDCSLHVPEPDLSRPRPVLEVGTREAPIPADKKAVIRLIAVDGQEPLSCPAIVCCGGRMDFHGAPLSRTWVKLGDTAKPGATTLTLSEQVTGWRAGDRVIVTATKLGRDNGQGERQTEQRTLLAIEGSTLTLDSPLAFEHLGTGDFRGEVANLSRNVVVESADPDGRRGHTMYHRGSAGGISYAEFRHLGKRDVLGRYSLHFHLVGNSMRGSSVIGASIWDSDNRWLTIHGTNYLLVRDCVGFQSVGHGFFLEDGTEIHNVLDRNLAVQARDGKRLPKQVLPFDSNDGAGFWWANSFNTFTRNVSCENDHYGYRFDATESSQLTLTLSVQQADGTARPTDIRTLPFVRFEDNEAHCDGLYGVNLGQGVNRVGPDARHPFVMRNTKIWEVHYALRPQAPNLLVENLRIHRSVYGVYHPNFDNHVYRNVTISSAGGDAEPFNRGHDDDSVQHGLLTVDGLTFAGHRNSGMPLIQISDHNPTGKAESHFRNVQVIDRKDEDRRALVNLGGGPRPRPNTPTSVPVYIHDYFGKGRHARVVSARSGELKGPESKDYRSEKPLTGDESRVTEVADVPFPELLFPIDDQPPATVITIVSRTAHGWQVAGISADNGVIREVLVNGSPARALRPDFSEWEVTLSALPADHRITSIGSDASGNTEQSPHTVQADAQE